MNSYSRRHSSILFCFILWSALAGASPALATTRVAASCDQKDVQAAIDTAFPGDTVLIPTGSCVWSSRLSITKYLIVKAAETRKTIITDNSPNLSNLIEILEIPYALSRPFAAPPGVPEDRAKALVKAFMEAHKDPGYLDEAKKANFDVSPIDGAEVLGLIKKIADTPDDQLRNIEKLVEGGG